MSTWRLLLLSLFLCTTWMGCSDDPDPTPDSGTPVDGGTRADAGTDPVDSGTDAGTDPTDSGTDPVDSGTDGGTDPVDSGTDGGTDPTDGGTDGGLDAGPPDNAVHIRRFNRYRTASGVTEQPQDFTLNPVELFVLDGGTFVSLPGEDVRPGEYVFPEVPHSTYYLKVGTTFIVTDARDLDLSFNRLGRADARIVETTEESVNLALDGLEPWDAFSPPYVLENPYSDLQVVSAELDFMTYLGPSTPQEGDVSVNEKGLTLYNNVGPTPVFEQARGDRAYVVQMSPRELGPLPDGGVQRYNTAVRSAHLPPFSFDGTAPMAIQATLEPLPMNELQLDWRVSEFAALAADVHPDVTLTRPSFYLSPMAHGAPEGWVGWSGELLSMYRPRGEASDVQGTLRYGSPYPSNWGVVGSATVSFSMPVKLPDGPTISISGNIGVLDRTSGLTAGPLAPRTWPPRDLQLDGTPAQAPRELSAGSHVLSWRPPATGQVDAYLVRMRRIERPDESTAFVATSHSFFMDGSVTSLVLPPSVFEAGKQYYVVVEAVRAEGYDVSDKPLTLPDREVSSQADTLTGLLTVPAPAP